LPAKVFISSLQNELRKEADSPPELRSCVSQVALLSRSSAEAQQRLSRGSSRAAAEQQQRAELSREVSAGSSAGKQRSAGAQRSSAEISREEGKYIMKSSIMRNGQKNMK
jgi:hypothetical protein